MKKLYKIWRITETTAYPFVDVVSVTIWYRNDLVSTDKDRLETLCHYLNFISTEDVRYEVREDVNASLLA
jgi:hypothetical protein